MGTYLKWRSYKEGPWAFSKSLADNRYNVGNKIVDETQPVWDSNHSGVPITNTHVPCGYWVGVPPSEIPELKPIVPIVYGFSGFQLYYIAWSPFVGGSLGRFVGLDISQDKTYYSDNGGVTWSLGGAPADTIGTTHQFTYANGLFIWTYNRSFYSQRTAVSTDGINWTYSADIPPGDIFMSDVTYHSQSGKYILTTGTGGGASRIYESDDALNWTYVEYAGLYITYFLEVHKNRIYALGRNYNVAKVSSASHPFIWGGLLGDSPWSVVGSTSQRGELRSNGNILVYSRAYMDESNNWHSIDIPELNIYRIDYNSYSIAFGATTFVSPRRYIFTSRDGINWNSAYVSTTTYELLDIAVGYDRVVVAARNRVVVSIL